MIEDIFLAYANEPSRNNPNYFQTFFSTVKDNISIDLSGVDEVVQHISDIALFNNANDILDYLSKNGSINHYHEDFRGALYHAMRATADERIDHYRDVEEFEQIKRKPDRDKLDRKKARHLRFMIDYEKERHFRCDYRALAIKHGWEDLCENAFFRKCYECFQFGFRDMLLEITKTTEFTEIEDLEGALFHAAEIGIVRTDPGIVYAEDGPFPREKLEGKQSYAMGYLQYVNGDIGNSSAAFNEFAYGLATLSLSNFLYRNDRRKLKLCPYCSKFFIARDIKRKHSCYSKECQKQWETDKKRKQRETDPVKYV